MLILELLLQIRCLVLGFSFLCEYLGVWEECFVVGFLSQVIVVDLVNYVFVKNRKKIVVGRVLVVFVDRILDFIGVVGYYGDNLVEKIISVFFQFLGYINDVMVNMIVFIVFYIEEENYNVVVLGCFYNLVILQLKFYGKFY